MDSRQNERGPPPSFNTTTTSTESTTHTSTKHSTVPTGSTCPTGTSTSATSSDTTVAIPANQLQTHGQTTAVGQSSAGILPKLPHNTSPVAAATSSAVSNTVLAMAGHSVGLDSGGEVGASGGGVSGSSGGQSMSAAGAAGSTMSSASPSTSMEKNDPTAAPNNVDTSSGAALTSSPKLLRPAVFDKLEQLVRDMQDDDHGVPVRSITTIFSTIPAAFMGYDLIEWLMDRLSIEDSLEAVHLANLLCQFGYYFPVNELKNLLVKDDSSLYRFQTPYYWPSQSHTPDNIEYAMYLYKKNSKNRGKTHGLEDYETEAYNNLKKIISSRWEFLTMQADEQLRLAKDRKKGDKIVSESQEKAYWRVYRPPPGFTTVVENSPVPSREQRVKARNRTYEHLAEELKFLRNYCTGFARSKVSATSEQLIDYAEKFLEFDAILTPVSPSSPWVSDDQSYWLLNQSIVELPTEKRVRRWGISLENLMTDPLGAQELLAYMKKEFCHENLRFWLAVQDLRYGPGNEAKIRKKVKEIWDEFLSTGAKAEINIDGKTFDATRAAKDSTMKGSASRFTYDMAADHVYKLLLKNDCYPRYIRSESYKTLLSNALDPGKKKKPIFSNPFTGANRIKQRQLPAAAADQLVNSAKPNKERITWEEFNIYGADAGEASSDSQDGNNESPRKRPQDENICPWEGTPADDTVINVSSSGRHATKESPEVGTKGSSSSGSMGKAGLPRRGSDPALPVSLNKTAPPTKISHSGNGGGANPVTEESKSPSVKLRGDQSPGSNTAGPGGLSSNAAVEKPITKKPSCKSRHHQHHHHQHGIGTSSVAARAVLAPSCPSAIENSLAGRSRTHHGKRDDSMSAACAISSTLDVGGALVDPGSSGRTSSGGESGKEYIQQRESSSGTCGTYPSSAVPSTASSHHHHHHHHHHHSSKNRDRKRSKRKKSSKISSSSVVAHSGTFTADIPVSTGNTSDSSAQKQEANLRGCDEFKPLEGTTARQHPKPHHQHSTSSLLSSSVRVPSALLSGAAQSIDGGSITAVASTQGRKGSANTVSIPSAAAAMAAGMVPPSLAQPPTKKIDHSQSSHAGHTVPTNTDITHGGTHTSGQHHHHRHHHHSHLHSHVAEGHKTTVVSESISISTTSSTMHFPGTSSKCTQTKLEDEEDTLIPTSPTLARQSPMLVGVATGTEESVSTSGSFSKMSVEESSGNATIRSSHHSHTKSTASTKHQGTSLPSQGHFISNTEPKLRSEQDISKVPVHSPNPKASHQSCKNEESDLSVPGEMIRDTSKNSKTRSLDESIKERELTQHLKEHPERPRGSKLKYGDGGPGPPTEDSAEGKEDNQQSTGDMPKPIGKEALQEEGACSVPKPGDKTTADTSNPPQDSGGVESSTTQTTWSTSTDVCPWEDEENRTDSHQPFIKTYATLGFL